jgi:bisphosphoglycerate-independent phosphoglycerate mutase (AlkP superfamily)
VEKMRDSAGNMYTAHTISPVPVAVMGSMRQLRNPYKDQPEDVFADTHGQALRDVVPTILDLWSMDQPKIMDGHSLLVN